MRATLFLAIPLFVACGDSGGTEPTPRENPDAVYIYPRFFESFDTSYTDYPQIGSNGGSPLDWEMTGASARQDGWALPGSIVQVHVQSPYYDTLDYVFEVPDSVTPNPEADGKRSYWPRIPLNRRTPAVVRVTWAADFSGPTITLDVYAPRGLQSVRLTSSYVYLLACLDTDISCEDRIVEYGHGPDWQADSSATQLRGRISFSGGWSSWPGGPPPPGYGRGGWQTTLNFNIADEQGFRGHWSCSGLRVPSSETEQPCIGLYNRHP